MGGAIFIKEHIVRIGACTFLSNTALRGGALYLDLGEIIKISF
jgi:predicted outer membrane repeat protein